MAREEEKKVTFRPGQSGNPRGRPKGARDRRSELRALLQPHSRALIAKAVELALEGDTTAIKLCLDRLIPQVKPKDEAVTFTLGPDGVNNPKGILATGENIIKAVSQSDLTPEQGRTLTAVLESQRKFMEMAELDQRLTALEKALEKEQNCAASGKIFAEN